MEIGLVYSSRDPQQLRAREFVKNFIEERGILARVIEYDRPVKSPTVVVNGNTLKDLRKKPRSDKPTMFPDIKAISKILEKHAWCL